jgi:hypothetical protein
MHSSATPFVSSFKERRLLTDSNFLGVSRGTTACCAQRLHEAEDQVSTIGIKLPLHCTLDEVQAVPFSLQKLTKLKS